MSFFSGTEGKRHLFVVLLSCTLHFLFWFFRSYFDVANLSEANPIKTIELTLVAPSPSPVMATLPPKVASTPPPPKVAPSKPRPQVLRPIPKPIPKPNPPVKDSQQSDEVTPLKALSEPLPSSQNKATVTGTVTQRAEWKSAGLQNAPAKYPERARQMDWQGRVMLRVQVMPNGTAGLVSVAESSGHDILDESALEAVKHWKFIPAKRDGVPVESFVNVPINFKLKKEGD